ncbi:hypothetical protein Pla52n_12310 [Stieleria varia]|uniref:Uncharacterized protein n=1 Tax=Stieleria varia TaxID=2528005 RepID=A0A5C6B142_9BACT|nr:hypothetical protein Pla52n_12310 [Stieleria varia]
MTEYGTPAQTLGGLDQAKRSKPSKAFGLCWTDCVMHSMTYALRLGVVPRPTAHT